MGVWLWLPALLALGGISGWWLWRKRAAHQAPDHATVSTDPSLPPAGLSPGSARFVFRGGYDARCLAADLVDMAIRGYLQIGREARVVGFRWRLQRQPEATDEGLTPIQRVLAERLFVRGAQVFELTDNNARRMAHACEGYEEMLLEQFPAREIQRWRGRVDAFAAYLASVASPEVDGALDADDYRARIAHAMALDASAAWSRRFVSSVGADAASTFASRVRWYHGSGSQVLSDLSELELALGQQLSAQIATLAKPPQGMFGLPGR